MENIDDCHIDLLSSNIESLSDAFDDNAMARGGLRYRNEKKRREITHRRYCGKFNKAQFFPSFLNFSNKKI